MHDNSTSVCYFRHCCPDQIINLFNFFLLWQCCLMLLFVFLLNLLHFLQQFSNFDLLYRYRQRHVSWTPYLYPTYPWVSLPFAVFLSLCLMTFKRDAFVVFSGVFTYPEPWPACECIFDSSSAWFLKSTMVYFDLWKKNLFWYQYCGPGQKSFLIPCSQSWISQHYELFNHLNFWAALLFWKLNNLLSSYAERTNFSSDLATLSWLNIWFKIRHLC